MSPTTSLIRYLARSALPVATRGKLTTLIFHRVLERPDPLLPELWDAAGFERQMRLVRELFNVLPLADAVVQLRAGRLPPRSAAITFDDGYRDNLEVAAPILTRLGLHATFFVADGFLDGGRMFNDTVIETFRRLPAGEVQLPLREPRIVTLGDAASRRAAIDAVLAEMKYLPPAARSAAVEQLAAPVADALPTDLMMRSAQVTELAGAGFEIGGHTVNHPILASIDHAAAAREIGANKARLESLIGRRLRLFAYPNGRPGRDYRAEHVALVRQAGYEAAVSTSPGVASATTDPYQLPRFTPWDLRAGRVELGFARNAFTRSDFALV